ncbi:MAG TPA: hypothetical protein VE870_12045 [Bacteroidales bacterium]|nr:hypothetical protein [Bacteroidales bacterium]
MKEALKFLGVIIMLAGVVILVVNISQGIVKNTGLGLSALLVIIGMVGYIVMNQRIE